MKKSTATRRPPVLMLEQEAETLTNLALGAEQRLPQVSEMLLAEIGRATIRTPARMADDVVTMGASVTFLDEASGAERTVQLVYPQQANIDAGRISILTPVGAGLIGLSAGQSILWPDRDGRERRLAIIKVERPAEQAG